MRKRHKQKRVVLTSQDPVTVTESAKVLHYSIDYISHGGVLKTGKQRKGVYTRLNNRLGIGKCQVRRVFRELAEKRLIFHINGLKGLISTDLDTLYNYLVPSYWHDHRELPSNLKFLQWDISAQTNLAFLMLRYSSDLSSAQYDSVYDLLHKTVKKFVEKARLYADTKEGIKYLRGALKNWLYRNKLKKRKILSDEHKESIKRAKIGHKHTEETRCKISERMKGNQNSLIKTTDTNTEKTILNKQEKSQNNYKTILYKDKTLSFLVKKKSPTGQNQNQEQPSEIDIERKLEKEKIAAEEERLIEQDAIERYTEYILNLASGIDCKPRPPKYGTRNPMYCPFRKDESFYDDLKQESKDETVGCV